MNRVLNFLRYILKKRKWRKLNTHNFTHISRRFPDDISKVTVGKMTYGPLTVQSYGNQKEKLSIGSYCSIAGNVVFLLGGEHPYKGLSTYPFRKYVCGSSENTYTKGPIVLKDDVWIGENCLILSGVEIGQGAIIAAGSTVTKDVPPYAIFANGRILKYRFSEKVINQLLTFDYENLNLQLVRNNVEDFYKEIPENNIEEHLKLLQGKINE